MDYQAVATSIVLPAIISLGVAIINNQRQKRIEFEYDYRKYILQKRKQIYESIEELISSFNKYSFGNLYLGDVKNIIIQLEPKFAHLQANDIWISRFMRNSLTEAESLLREIERNVDSVGVSAPTKKRLVQEWRRVKARLVDEYFDDIMNLNQIESFKRKKVKEYKYSVKYLEEEVHQATLREATDDFKDPI